MPEHVHLLFSEPERGNPSLVLAALKQTFAHRLLDDFAPRAVPRQTRFGVHPSPWDMFGNVASTILLCLPKINEWKSCATYRNPVERGLVLEPQQWLWSSFRHYAYGERGPVLAELGIRKIS
jgi:putative transposase